MVANATDGLFHYINLDDYPLNNPQGNRWNTAVTRIKQELDRNGCSVLKNFIRPEGVALMRQEGLSVAPHAYRHLETVNAYNIEIGSDLPKDHPARITFEKGNAFVARDKIDRNTLMSQLYHNTTFKTFVAECFEMTELHELADPLAALCLNVLDPGRSHPWHFDKNEFTVSLLTQAPEGGGIFEYCPDIRSPENENFDQIRPILTNECDKQVKRLILSPGDLQFFKGRFALHRVTPVEGKTERHTAIFAYSDKPGVIGHPERTRQLFGRILPEHETTVQKPVKSDALLD